MSKLTRAQENNERHIMALYYAFGRKDAGAKVDPGTFAEYYAKMFADVQSGVTSFCPSVQDAFGYFESTMVTP